MPKTTEDIEGAQDLGAASNFWEEAGGQHCCRQGVEHSHGGRRGPSVCGSDLRMGWRVQLVDREDSSLGSGPWTRRAPVVWAWFKQGGMVLCEYDLHIVEGVQEKAGAL